MSPSKTSEILRYPSDYEFELSVIIPVGGSNQNFSRLHKNILSAAAHGFQVILIMDNLDLEAKIGITSFLSLNDRLVSNVKKFEVELESPGLARNFGLNHATGEFITFWDADDLANCGNISKALEARSSKSKAIIGSFLKRDVLQNSLKRYPPKKGFWPIQLVWNPGFWRILYRRECLSGASFGTSMMGEDQIFLAKFGIWTKSVEIVNTDFYSYFVGDPNQNVLDRIFTNLLICRLMITKLKSRIKKEK